MITVAGHPLPPRLLESDDPALVAWRAKLPGRVEKVLDQWELRASAPFTPGGSSAWVAPVTGAGGEQLVLKVTFAHDEARDEALGMRAWQDRGAARVHRAERDDSTTLLLMERIAPGTPLAGQLTGPERDEVLAALARQLWVPPADVLPPADAARLRPLADMCAQWADEAETRLARTGGAYRSGAQAPTTSLPPELIAHGLALFRRLPHEWTREPVLLATDLHGENVLARTALTGACTGSTARGTGPRDPSIGAPKLVTGPHHASAGPVPAGPHHASAGPVPAGPHNTSAAPAPAGLRGMRWALIDPKPYVGDPHYDLLQHMFNEPERLATDPAGLAERLATLAGLDADRLRCWLLARCVQEAGVLDAAATAAQRLWADGVR